MIIERSNLKQYKQQVTTISLVNYGDIKEGDTVELVDYEQAPKGYCSFYRVTPVGSTKVHYLYTAEVTRDNS